MAMPKDGTPILAYCENDHSEGWMVIEWTGHYWQTRPGKYGVRKIIAWTKLQMTPSSAPVEMAGDFELQPYGDGER